MGKLQILVQRASINKPPVLKEPSSFRFLDFKRNNITFVTGIKYDNASSSACRGIDDIDLFDALSYGIIGNELKEIGKFNKK